MIKNLFRKLIGIDHPPTVNQEQVKPLISDYASSPLRFELDVLIEEYRSLRAETEQRIANEQQIISYALGIIAAIIAVGQFLPSLEDHYPDLITSLRPAYLFVSLVFSAFALMNIEHDSMMVTIGIYIDKKLRPRIEEILSTVSEKDPIVFEWDLFRSKFQFNQPQNAPFFYLMAASRYAITIIPSIFFVILYWSNAAKVEYKPVWETLLFSFAVFVIIWIFVSVLFSGKLYMNLPDQIVIDSNSGKVSSTKFFNQSIVKFVALILLIVIYLGLGLAIATKQFYASHYAQVDFNTYFAAAKLLSQGKNIYDGGLTKDLINSYNLEYINGSNYIYPPYLAFALSSLIFLHPLVLGFLWYLGSLIALCIAVWLISPYSNLSAETPEGTLGWPDTLLFVLLFVPTLFSFYIGQVNAIVLLLLSMTFFYLRKNKQIVAGILLGISIIVKVAPIFLLLYLIAKKQYKALISTLIFILCVILATFPFLRRYLVTYFSAVVPDLATPNAHPVNQSLNGFYSRMFTANIFTAPVFNSPNSVRILTALTSILLVLLVIFIFMKRREQVLLPRNSSLLFGVLITLMVIISPLAWENFYILLAFPIVILLSKWMSLTKGDRKLIITSFCLITLQRAWDPFINHPNNYPILHNFSLLMSLGLYGALLLIWLQLRLLIVPVSMSPKGN